MNWTTRMGLLAGSGARRCCRPAAAVLDPTLCEALDALVDVLLIAHLPASGQAG